MRNTEKEQEVKQKLPNEIEDLFLLKYDYDVEYEVFVEDGYSIGSRNINLFGKKYFTSEKEINEWKSNIEDYSLELPCDVEINPQAGVTNINDDYSVSSKISLIEYLKKDRKSFFDYLDKFLIDNPEYNIQGNLKLVKSNQDNKFNK